MIVTLSGSARFEQEFITAQRELSRGGINFFSLAVLPQNREPGEDWADGSYDKTMGDLLYFDRILHSDAVIVLASDYIGMSTAREILWANIQGKLIHAHPFNADWPTTIARVKMHAAPDHAHIVARAEEYFKTDRANLAGRPPTPATAVLDRRFDTGERSPRGYHPVEDER